MKRILPCLAMLTTIVQLPAFGADETTRASAPAFKGYELYSRQDADGNWLYSLVPGTNRLKTKEEILAASADMSALRTQLSTLAVNEEVMWQNSLGSSLPDAKVVEDLRSFCRMLRIDLEVPQ